MTHLTQTATLPLGALTVHRAVEAFYAVVAAAKARYGAYRTLRALDGLTDRQLDDIGLTRADLNILHEKSVF